MAQSIDYSFQSKEPLTPDTAPRQLAMAMQSSSKINKDDLQSS